MKALKINLLISTEQNTYEFRIPEFYDKLKALFRFENSLVNPQAVGMDSGVQFCLSNFLEDILQPTSSKMSPTSNLGL